MKKIFKLEKGDKIFLHGRYFQYLGKGLYIDIKSYTIYEGNSRIEDEIDTISLRYVCDGHIASHLIQIGKEWPIPTKDTISTIR